MLFPLGKLLATPGALRFCEEHGVDLLRLLTRHGSGDWGEMGLEDRSANDAALKDGSRIFSSYRFPAGAVWIITEAQNDQGLRECTTVLLPSEY